jgi:hypothetical protein
MKKLLAAMAFSIALPSIAHAAEMPPPKEDRCAKMKAEGKKCCCDDMDKAAHAENSQDHSGHTMPDQPSH